MGFGIRYFELDPEAVRQRLHALGARRHQPPHRVRKVALAGQNGAWAGLRSDGERHVLALMRDNQPAREVLVQDFDAVWQILEGLGLATSGQQDSMQEGWDLHGIEFRLSEAPGLAPSLEIYGPQEEHVRWAVLQLGLDPTRARLPSAAPGPAPPPPTQTPHPPTPFTPPAPTPSSPAPTAPVPPAPTLPPPTSPSPVPPPPAHPAFAPLTPPPPSSASPASAHSTSAAPASAPPSSAHSASAHSTSAAPASTPPGSVPSAATPPAPGAPAHTPPTPTPSASALPASAHSTSVPPASTSPASAASASPGSGLPGATPPRTGAPAHAPLTHAHSTSAPSASAHSASAASASTSPGSGSSGATPLGTGSPAHVLGAAAALGAVGAGAGGSGRVSLGAVGSAGGDLGLGGVSSGGGGRGEVEGQTLVTVPLPPLGAGRGDAGTGVGAGGGEEPERLRQFVVAETGWTDEASEWVPGEHWIHWAVVLENPNTRYWCEFPTIRISVRDEQGRLLGQHEQVLTALPPGTRIGWANAMEITGNRPHTLEITPRPADWYPAESRPEDFPPFTYRGVQFDVRGQECEVTGEIVNPYPLRIEEVALVALFRDARGSLVSGEMTFVEGLPAQGTAPFKVEATVPTPYGPIASLDLLAVPWSSGDSNPWESALHH